MAFAAATTNAEEAHHLKLARQLSLNDKEAQTQEYKRFRESSSEDDIIHLFNRLYETRAAFLEGVRDTYRFVPAAGDGNCLFNAIALQLYGDAEPDQPAQLRAAAMNWIRTHPDDFGEFIYGETGESVPQYVARMSQNGVYGGDIEIRALSQRFKLPFVVYSYSTHTNTMTSVLFDNEGTLRDVPPVTLLHGGIVLHYDALFLNIADMYPFRNIEITNLPVITQQAWTASLHIANEVRRIHDAAEEQIRTEAAIAAVAAAGGGGGSGPVTRTTGTPSKEPVDDIATSLAASLLFQTAALAAHVGLTPRLPPAGSGSGSGSGSGTIITSAVPIGAPLTMPLVPGAAGTGAAGAGPASLFTGDEVYMCVTYANKLFFYVNTPEGKMTVPHGPILKADSSPAAAALRILDTYITGHGLLDTNLVEFHVAIGKQKRKIYYFYGVVPMPPPPPKAAAAAATATATTAGAIVPLTTGTLVPVLPGPPPPVAAAAKPVQLFTNAAPIPADVDGAFTGLPGFPLGSATGAGAGGAGPGATKPKGPAAVRVVSYNILSENLSPAHINSAKWLAGRKALLKAKLDAEIKKDSIICLQEVSDADDAFLRANVFAGPAYTYQRAPWTNPKLAPPGVNIFGVVIAFPNKKYNILSTKKSSTVKPSSGIENILLNIALTETATANNFCVSTYHMPISWTKGSSSTIDHAAMAQHAAAATMAADKYAGIMPYIFCGDCNIQSFIQDKPTDPKTPNPAYNALFGHPLKLRSVYKDKNKKEPALTTFSHRMTMDKSGRPVIDTATRMPQLEPLFQGTLDYIFISPGWTVTKVDTLPSVTAPIPDAKEPSDHLMIGSDLQLVPGMAGTGAGVPSPGPPAGPTTNTAPPYSDGDIQALRLWIVDKIATPLKTRAMVNMLKRLAQKMGLPLPPGVSERDFIDLPTWAIGLFDVKDIKENCFGRQIITRDCSPLRILQDILDADEYANEYRILDGDSDAKRIYYDALVAQIAAESDLTKKAVLQKKFYKAFRDKVLHIKQDAPGPATTWAPPPPLAQYKRKIPNKYRARAYRNKVTTWGDHTVAGSDAEAEYNKLSFDEKPMYQQNVGILEPLVQPEIWKNDATKDKAMTIAVLESLWDCGLNPTMDGKSSCFPAQVIAELREYGNKRTQGSQQAHAKRILTNNDWPFLQGMLNVIKSVIGATPFPKLPRRAAVAPVAPVAGGPGPGGGGAPRPPTFGPSPFTGPGGGGPRPPFTGPGGPPRPPFTGPGSTFRPPFTGGTPRPPFTGPGPSILRGPTGAATLSSGLGGRGGPAPRAPPPSSHIIPNLMLGGHAAILPNRMLGAGLTRLPPIRRRG